MKARYLLPSGVKKPGWVLFSIGLIAAILTPIIKPESLGVSIKVFAVVSDEFMGDIKWFHFTSTNPIDEITLILLIIGGLFVAFAREKDEDEFIGKLRLESLVWATYINYSILLLAVLFVYEIAFLWIMLANMFTLLVFFIVRFHWVLYQSRKNLHDYEE
jgi:heme/copper-type cytochrome/quinol oxidase subunit 2